MGSAMIEKALQVSLIKDFVNNSRNFVRTLSKVPLFYTLKDILLVRKI
jgi:hypothetical protein